MGTAVKSIRRKPVGKKPPVKKKPGVKSKPKPSSPLQDAIKKWEELYKINTKVEDKPVEQLKTTVFKGTEQQWKELEDGSTDVHAKLLDSYSIFNHQKELDYILNHYDSDNGCELHLYASDQAPWADHVRGKKLASLVDDGDSVQVSFSDTIESLHDNDNNGVILDYAQAEYVRILFHMKRLLIDNSDLYELKVFKNQEIAKL